jgi:hypothetical protein
MAKITGQTGQAKMLRTRATIALEEVTGPVATTTVGAAIGLDSPHIDSADDWDGAAGSWLFPSGS